jgi:uncharacterized protein YdeI (YjbR/CyaY-like superfamily)
MFSCGSLDSVSCDRCPDGAAAFGQTQIGWSPQVVPRYNARVKSSRDPRIDAYIGKSTEFARPILTHLRELVHQGCPTAEETIKWGMPFFMHHGILCYMAAFKAHCGFGFRHREMEQLLAAENAQAGTAMGNLGRLTRLKDLPSDKKLLGYIARAAKLNESAKSVRGIKAKRLELRVPEDLAAALRKNRVAAKTFEGFPPSHRREYLEWIAEAKRPETRQKRLETTLQWLTEGKSRNWKYTAS